ncbi:MAG: HAD-IA family hydrolase [Spirochaetia bacterium]|nr:HAD-IA family hydrolase [Spirochaetia bacterium]MCI7576974.1 HAD-IA family hydrolase [Spirochaetia bacterium]
MKNIKAVIFDLDGTLLDTIQDLADSCNKTLEQLGMPPRTLEEVRSFVGNGIARLMEQAVPKGKDNKDFEKSVELMKKNYSSNWHNKTKPYDGIMDLISALKERGIKIGINSNKPDPQVKELARLYFSEVVDETTAVGEKEGFKRKPFPDLANEIIRIMGVEKEEVIYIGDSEVDVATARNAGIKCISVTWGFRSRKLLEENGAKIFADKPEEILNLIERL